MFAPTRCMHSVVKKGLVRVVYGCEADMKPELQRDVLATIEKELASGAVAVVFTVVQAAGVDKSVPAFWMDVTKKHAPKLCAMAIASPSMVVRTAASGFSVANKLRRVNTTVHAFHTEAEALAWAVAQLEAA